MNDIELHNPNQLAAQMDYARAVAPGSMLPDNYRNKPADILIAIGLGQAMGLSPAESLYRIAVIKGKPTASAELIASQVRKAGHKLRVKGDETSCTATIIRADDPDFPFEVTRDIMWAKDMGLASKDNYKSQPGTMLQWRAITAVARLACPEALYGVQHTPDEVMDSGEIDLSHKAPSSGLGAALAPQAQEETKAEELDEEVVDGEVVEEQQDEGLPIETGVLLNTSSKLAKAMYASVKDAGIPEPERITFLSNVIGRQISSSSQMTEQEARDVLAFIDAETRAAQS